MDISSMTTAEAIIIDASFRAAMYDAWQCRRKEEELIERWGDRPGIEAPLKALKNRCAAPIELRFGNLVYHRCLCNFQRDIGFIFSLYEAYDKGILPFPGGVCDQPAKAMEMIHHIKSLSYEKQERDQAEQAKKNQKKSKR